MANISPEMAATYILDCKGNVRLPSGTNVGKVCEKNPCGAAVNDKIAFLRQQRRCEELQRVLQEQVVGLRGHEEDVVVVEQEAVEGVAESQVIREEVV